MIHEVAYCGASPDPGAWGPPGLAGGGGGGVPPATLGIDSFQGFNE